jgi:uncharacterized membrane protein
MIVFFISLIATFCGALFHNQELSTIAIPILVISGVLIVYPSLPEFIVNYFFG